VQGNVFGPVPFTFSRTVQGRPSTPLNDSEFGANLMLPSFQMLGVRVDALQIRDTVDQMCSWINDRGPKTRFVAVTGMHGVAEARENSQFRAILNAADLVVPDGMPLVWVARVKGHALRHRVCGSELMTHFCRETGDSYRHFFYGGAPGVAEELAQTLHREHGIIVAGTYTPPFHPLSEDQEKEITSLLKAASPDVLWVGLSTPKQEKWIYEHRSNLRVPVMLGVGAAFDMNSGKLHRAPKWMRDRGFEWLFRLASEPRRLWRRYLVTIPKTACFVCLELLGSALARPAAAEATRGATSNSTGKVTEKLNKRGRAPVKDTSARKLFPTRMRKERSL
jgi:N-acetylglucosaminyldiphosphoundecaprenol N-acetyl-beta-D-mannosaminyltransferase